MAEEPAQLRLLVCLCVPLRHGGLRVVRLLWWLRWFQGWAEQKLHGSLWPQLRNHMASCARSLARCSGSRCSPKQLNSEVAAHVGLLPPLGLWEAVSEHRRQEPFILYFPKSSGGGRHCGWGRSWDAAVTLAAIFSAIASLPLLLTQGTSSESRMGSILGALPVSMVLARPAFFPRWSSRLQSVSVGNDWKTAREAGFEVAKKRLGVDLLFPVTEARGPCVPIELGNAASDWRGDPYNVWDDSKIFSCWSTSPMTPAVSGCTTTGCVTWVRRSLSWLPISSVTSSCLWERASENSLRPTSFGCTSQLWIT